MIRYGALAQSMQPIPAREVFMQHIKLLIIMTKAYLKGNPLGDFRKAAIVRTARFIFSQARAQSDDLATASGKTASSADDRSTQLLADHIFLQRTQMLAVMANAFANGNVSGRHRKLAMVENIQRITDHLSRPSLLTDTKTQKVA